MLYDTHSHPYLADNKSQEDILQNFFQNEGTLLNSIAIDIETSITCIDLAKKHDGVRASIGIHPTHTPMYEGQLNETITELEYLYNEESEHIVAIGECGLDYHWIPSLATQYHMGLDEVRELQVEFFRAQIHLAHDLQLPLVIHNRDAGEDVFKILKEEECTNFVFHCFTENLDFAQRLLEFAPDCKLGFGGVCTFKNAQSIQEVIANIPLKNIIIETDSPYLTPVPYRGKEENEPLFVKYVLDTIIDLRDEDEETIKNQIFENSTSFFIKK